MQQIMGIKEMQNILEEDDIRRAARIQAKKAMVTHSPACNFEAFSLYFHLPLKAAAEKFGVRATAFKKRCRAIGIRHWPYRKVRSLKRSLQELNRCKDSGTLNEKQQYQYATFKKQLDRLMSPETYGIDPSGHFVHNFQDDDDDSGDDLYSVDSPRFGSGLVSDCSISPSEADNKTQNFMDYPSTIQLPSLRKSSANLYQSIPRLSAPTLSSDIPGLSLRMTQKDLTNFSHCKSQYPGEISSFLEEKLGGKELLPAFHSELLDGVYGDHPSSGSCIEHSHEDIVLGGIKYEDIRPLHEPDEDFHEGGVVPHVDYSNERFFDDVFLQISPDYGCLV